MSLLRSVEAATVQFVIDESRSSLTLAGDILGAPFEQQAEGSLVTSLSGKLMCHESDLGIQFMGGSSITASSNGSWWPGPKGAALFAPADCAARVNTIVGPLDCAIRQLVFDVTSTIQPFGIGEFDGSGLTFHFPQTAAASFDCTSLVVGEKSIPLTGSATNEIVHGASLRMVDGVQRLTVEFDVRFRFTTLVEGDSIARFKGVIVANQIEIPIISSIAVSSQSVRVQTQGFTSSGSLQTSTDLKTWTPQTATRGEGEAGSFFTCPAAGPARFFRIAP
ncbi:MAG: hypothetical protein U1G07_16670 [Verrucomicrobiota bacterium]